jgi:hypothetical protein
MIARRAEGGTVGKDQVPAAPAGRAKAQHAAEA